MRRIILFGGWLGLGISMAQAPAFDVASVTPSAMARAGVEGSGREHITWTRTAVTIENASLSACIQWAYEVKFYQIDGPGWTVGERFDIVGKTNRPGSVGQLRMMLRTLLADRFRLTLHRATKSMPVFDLVAAKAGPRMQPSDGDGAPSLRVENQRFVFRHMTMPELAERLSGLAGVERPVVDKTGIAGAFDFSLPAIPHMPDDGEATWLFAALEEGIGLALKPSKEPIEILAIDHAERPSPN